MNKEIILYVIVAVALTLISYGIYWASKQVIYSFFYKELVEQTIHETVKSECLIHEKR